MQNSSESLSIEIKNYSDEFFTPLARVLVNIWLKIVSERDKLEESSRYRKKAFIKIANKFMRMVKTNPDLLDPDKAYIDHDLSFVKYCDTPYLLKFHNTTVIVAHIPHTFYMYSHSYLLFRILRRIKSFLRLNSLQNHKSPREIIDATTFIGWLLEEGRKIPLPLTEHDVLILKTVSFLPHFEKSITLNHGERILRLMGLSKNTGQFNRYLARLNKNSIWRAKFNVDASKLGFQTFYLPPMSMQEYQALLDAHPELELSFVFKMKTKGKRPITRGLDNIFKSLDTTHVHGIIQLPLYGSILDELDDIGLWHLTKLRVTSNLHYLHKGVNEAAYPITFDFSMIFEPTNAMTLNLSPLWEQTLKLSDNCMRLIQYFSDPNNPMTTFSLLSKATGIHRISVPRLMHYLVSKDFLYYFPLFTRIGMDHRFIAIFFSDDSYNLKAIESALARLPRCVSFLSDEMLFAYLSVGEAQVIKLLEQIRLFPRDIQYYLIPWASFNEDYQYNYNPALHLMKWHRREDRLILFENYL